MNKILPIILIVIMTFVAYGVYKQANKSIKTKRIECQSKTTTFEKINIEQPLKEAVNSLKSNNYTIKSSIEYSKFMKSNLVNILTKEQADEKLEKITNLPVGLTCKIKSFLKRSFTSCRCWIATTLGISISFTSL